MLPPIETGAGVESRPRTRRESARISFTGILSELRVLEACDFPLASSRWRGKGSLGRRRRILRQAQRGIAYVGVTVITG